MRSESRKYRGDACEEKAPAVVLRSNGVRKVLSSLMVNLVVWRDKSLAGVEGGGKVFEGCAKERNHFYLILIVP